MVACLKGGRWIWVVGATWISNPEIQQIRKVQSAIGNQFEQLAKLLPGRTENNVKKLLVFAS